MIAGADVVVAPPGETPFWAAAYGKSIVVVRYPEWSRAGTIKDAGLFARKSSASFLSQISTVNLLEAIQYCENKPTLEIINGAEILAEYKHTNFLNVKFDCLNIVQHPEYFIVRTIFVIEILEHPFDQYLHRKLPT